jgi:5-methylcytosine-specific restriction endonuclease McrA
MNKRGPKPPVEVNTDKLCLYGCGQTAKFQNRSGNLMCSRSANMCPSNILKNSLAIKEAHQDGRCIRAANLTKDQLANNKGKRYAEFGVPGKGQFKNALISERGHKCEMCGNAEWLGHKITLELEHTDGNRQNNTKDNLKLLCPNCHSVTPTWRGRNKNKGQKYVSDSEFKQALLESPNIRQALLKLGLTAKAGNYKRAYELLRV